MALIKADRVKETSNSETTANFILGGAATGYRTFSSVCVVGDTFHYAIVNQSNGQWEVGIGTYGLTNTLERTTVLSSSNSNAKVNFSAGTKEVFLTASANYLERIVDNGLLTSTGSSTSIVAVNDGPQPQLDLAFSADKTLTARYGPTPSYSRASTGTYFNASGILTTAAINTPRFDHAFENGVWVSKGLLIEEQRTNQATRSSTLGAGWAVADLTKTYSASYIAPDGTAGASLCYPSTSGTQRRIYKGVVSTYVISFFVKMAGKRFVYMLTGGYADQAYFDLQNKTVTYTPAGNTATIQDVGNGWCRISLWDGNGFAYTQIGISDASGSTNVTANGTDGVLVWGAQAESGTFPTSYISSAASPATRSADVCQISGGDFYSFWNKNEGSVSVEQELLTGANSVSGQRLFAIAGIYNNPAITLYYDNASNMRWLKYWSGSTGDLSMSSTPSSFKAVMAFKSGSHAASLNGGNIVSSSDATFGTDFYKLDIGYQVGYTVSSGWVRRIRYFNSRLENQSLIQLSGGINNLSYKTVTGSGNATVTNNYGNINVSVPNPLPVANGGTGGTTAVSGAVNLIKSAPNDGAEYTLKSKQISGVPSFYWVDSTGYAPTLDLLFASDKSLTAYTGPTPSFSRASSGTYFDSNGILRYANVNLLTYSEDFTNAAWTPSDSYVSPNRSVAPDGKTTADKLFENSSNAVHYISFSAGKMSLDGTYTNSIHAKRSERGWIRLYIYNGTDSIGAYFNLTNGTVGSISSGITASISSVGNDWYRCSVTRTITGSASANGGVVIAKSDGEQSYIGEGNSGVFIWGAQLESVPAVGLYTTTQTISTYAPTTSAVNASPRFDHVFNGTSWVSRGLLIEEQRTNGISYSRDFSAGVNTLNATLTTNTNLVTSPEGGTNAAEIAATSTGPSFVYVGTGSSSSTVYTVSIYAKQGTSPFIYMYDQFNVAAAWFNLSNGTVGSTLNGATASIINVGNGWYRCIFTKDNTGVSPVANRLDIGVSDTAGSYAVTNGRTAYVYGVQREVGSFATSYIPTTSSTATRSADVCQITGSDFSSLWNASQGSIAVEYDRLSPSFGRVFSFTNSGHGSYLDYGTLGGNEIVDISDNLTTQAALNVGANLSAGATGKMATAFALNDFAAVRNNGTAATDASGTLPAPTLVEIGCAAITGQSINGHIARLRYYPVRIPNTAIQTLST